MSAFRDRRERLFFLRRRHSDRGSVLMLTVGMVPVLVGMLAVGVDVSVLVAARRAITADADAAVLAAAQSADLVKLYSGAELSELPIDCAAARRAVEGRVGGARSDSRATMTRVVQFSCRSNTVSIAVKKRIRLPFASHFGVDPEVEVAADAAARSPFR